MSRAVPPRGKSAKIPTYAGREVEHHLPTLRFGGLVSPKLTDKAELARIGFYYATESMLVLEREIGRYDADATPSFRTETPFDFYAGTIDALSRRNFLN